jgi:glycosyltransferase involved in cell wall biosynthesis
LSRRAVGKSTDRVWVVIPAYNEAAVIESVLRALLRHFARVVVVDDCSTDATGALSRAAGAAVLRHPINLGQGAALQTGIDYALGQGADAIVTFDADGQHNPADAVAMVDLLRDARCDVVLGSRFRGATLGMPWRKRLLLRLAVAYTRFTTGLDLSDTHNGLRVLSRAAAQRIRITQDRMAHASEILAQIAKQGLSYREAPCTIAYTRHSTAKGQPLMGSFTILRDLMVRRLY